VPLGVDGLLQHSVVVVDELRGFPLGIRPRSFAVAGVVDPDPDDEGLTINNTSNIFSAEEGVAGIALYDPNDDQYYAIQMGCPGSGT
jgi:hypothetical protein